MLRAAVKAVFAIALSVALVAIPRAAEPAHAIDLSLPISQEEFLDGFRSRLLELQVGEGDTPETIRAKCKTIAVEYVYDTCIVDKKKISKTDFEGLMEAGPGYETGARLERALGYVESAFKAADVVEALGTFVTLGSSVSRLTNLAVEFGGFSEENLTQEDIDTTLDALGGIYAAAGDIAGFVPVSDRF